MQMLVVLVGVGFVWWRCAHGVGNMYRRRGRSQSQGLLLGFALGPVGLVIAAATPRRDLRNKVRCLRCREWVDELRDRCPHCDTKLRVGTTTSRSPRVLVGSR